MRGADRNRSLADQADPATDEMLLPQLDDGITLLDVEGGRGVPILQSLVLDHLLLHDGPAFWVDANGHATTTTLRPDLPQPAVARTDSCRTWVHRLPTLRRRL